MKKVIVLHKKEGETPLEAVENFRNKNPEYPGIPLTYAGRLDPMASGVLVILAGEETKSKEKYLALEKEYDFEVLFGFGTDTYDVLGKVTKHTVKIIQRKELEKEIKKNLRSFVGEITQQYPMYSSKTVNGKPLFAYAREGKGMVTPTRRVFIKKLRLIKIREIDNKRLFKNIERRIRKVHGDFRQNEILRIWKKNLLTNTDGRKFFVASFKIKCSSGTYVRTVADTLGYKLQIGALAFSIKRTKVGNYA